MASGGLRWPDRPPIPRPRSASTSRAPCATGSSTGCSTGSGSPRTGRPRARCWPPAGRRRPDRRRRAGHRQLLLIETAGQAGPVDLQGRHDEGAAAPSTPWSCSASTASARSSSASGPRPRRGAARRRPRRPRRACRASWRPRRPAAPGWPATAGRAASPPPAAAACHVCLGQRDAVLVGARGWQSCRARCWASTRSAISRR